MKVLEPWQATLLVTEAVKRCGNTHAAAVVILPGGKQIAHTTNAPMGRTLLVREICIMAAQKGADIVEVPCEWAARQPEATVPAPALTGAALRIYARVAAHAGQSPRVVGVIGLLGVDAPQALQILTDVLVGNNLLPYSGLPSADGLG